MVSSGLLRRVALVSTLMKEAPGSSEPSVLKIATRRNNPEDTSLHSHRPENHKSPQMFWVSQNSKTSYVESGVFWDIKLCGSCKNQRFGRTCQMTSSQDICGKMDIVSEFGSCFIMLHLSFLSFSPFCVTAFLL
jgi:hypothetical protein